jgi:hypothetical protein
MMVDERGMDETTDWRKSCVALQKACDEEAVEPSITKTTSTSCDAEGHTSEVGWRRMREREVVMTPAESVITKEISRVAEFISSWKLK